MEGPTGAGTGIPGPDAVANEAAEEEQESANSRAQDGGSERFGRRKGANELQEEGYERGSEGGEEEARGATEGQGGEGGESGAGAHLLGRAVGEDVAGEDEEEGDHGFGSVEETEERELEDMVVGRGLGDGAGAVADTGAAAVAVSIVHAVMVRAVRPVVDEDDDRGKTADTGQIGERIAAVGLGDKHWGRRGRAAAAAEKKLDEGRQEGDQKIRQSGAKRGYDGAQRRCARGRGRDLFLSIFEINDVVIIIVVVVVVVPGQKRTAEHRYPWSERRGRWGDGGRPSHMLYPCLLYELYNPLLPGQVLGGKVLTIL